MSTSEAQEGPADQAEQGAPQTHLPILALIDAVQRVCRPDSPAETFIAEVLRGFVSLSDAFYGAYWRASPGAPAVDMVAELMPRVSEQGARAWAPTLSELAAGVIQQSIIRYQAVSEQDGELLTGQKHMALGFPVRGDEDTTGCITVVVRQDSAILSDAGIAMLRLMADFGMLYSAVRSSARYERYYELLSNAWDVVGEALAFSKDSEMAHVLADRSRLSFGADRVAVGLARGGKVVIAAMSGEDMLDKRSNVVRQFAATQTEVLVSAEAGLYEAEADQQTRAEQTARNPQHEKLASQSEARVVYTVPLLRDGEVIGAWTLEFGSTPFTDELRQVIEVAAGQIGPVLDLARRGARGPIARTGDALSAGAKWVFGKEHPWRKAAGVAVAALLAFAIFGKADFTITGSCTLEPSVRRIYSAPFETAIRAAPVRPGDQVAEGDVLVEFDREELELELREAYSNRVRAVKKADALRAQEKIGEAEIAKAEARGLADKIALLERHLSRAELRADFSGIVITGDLTHDIGRSVRMGEALIEVAPLATLILEIEADQGDIDYLALGQKGRFTTKARPGEPIEFAVAKIRPMPEARNGASVYIAEATVENTDGWLRPGMEGAAKVNVGRRNAVWVWTRKIVGWLRLHLWW